MTLAPTGYDWAEPLHPAEGGRQMCSHGAGYRKEQSGQALALYPAILGSIPGFSQFS